MKTNALKAFYAALKLAAPSINISASKEIDHSFRWDGDGPDPVTEGLYPHDVTVTARAIVGGEMVEGNAYLGGCYYESDAKGVDDIQGYLNQMVDEALCVLDGLQGLPHLFDEIKAAKAFLKTEREAGYAAHRIEIEAQNAKA